MNTKHVQKLCLAVGLATAWVGAQASIETRDFNVSITPNQAMGSAYFLFTLNGSGSNVSSGFLAQTLEANQTYSETLTVDTGGLGYYIDEGWVSTTILGLYDYDGNGTVDIHDGDHVSVLMDNQVANNTIGLLEWGDVFSGFTEAEIASALRNGDTETLEYFVYTYPNSFNMPLVNNPGTLVNFSTASYGGNAVALVIPEPATISTIFAGLLGLLGLKRKK